VLSKKGAQMTKQTLILLSYFLILNNLIANELTQRGYRTYQNSSKFVIKHKSNFINPLLRVVKLPEEVVLPLFAEIKLNEANNKLREVTKKLEQKRPSAFLGQAHSEYATSIKSKKQKRFIFEFDFNLDGIVDFHIRPEAFYRPDKSGGYDTIKPYKYENNPLFCDKLYKGVSVLGQTPFTPLFTEVIITPNKYTIETKNTKTNLVQNLFLKNPEIKSAVVSKLSDGNLSIVLTFNDEKTQTIKTNLSW
jgi:hypothetical protein